MTPSATDTIDVVIVDDQPVVREGLPTLLARGDIVVRATSPADPEAADLVSEAKPAVALIGLGLHDTRGLDLVRRLSRRANGTSVLLHVRDTTAPAQIARARRWGAAGAVSTRSPLAELHEAIRTVAAGGKFFRTEEVTGRRTSELSTRELRVLAEIACGHSLEVVAERLHLSPHTVRTHLRNVMRKLDAQTRAHAVAIALSEGAIEIDP